MGTKIVLNSTYRGFEAGTEFERVATYGSWHPASAKLEARDGSYRHIEVTTDQLEQHFAA